MKETTMTTANTPETGTLTKRPPTKIETFRDVLGKMKNQLAVALPKHLDVDRMLRIVFTTVQRNPALLDCTRDSLLGCIVQCAQLGLEPDGLLGHAYLIPFKNRKENRLECQLIIGYKGLLKLARQSGEIASVSARVVYSKDLFEYEYGLNEKLRHIPYVQQEEKDDSGVPVFAYAIFRLKDGSHHFDVMSYREIEFIRKGSPSGNSPAWSDHWDEMAKKTAIRRAAKMSPASIEDRMARAISLDERADAGVPQEIESEDALKAIAAIEPQETVLEQPAAKEGERVPLRRPAKAKGPIEVPPPEDPDAADRKAAEPTAAELAGYEAASKGTGPSMDPEAAREQREAGEVISAGTKKAAPADEEKAPWDK
jgi:recombination protein RecT